MFVHSSHFFSPILQCSRMVQSQMVHNSFLVCTRCVVVCEAPRRASTRADDVWSMLEQPGGEIFGVVLTLYLLSARTVRTLFSPRSEVSSRRPDSRLPRLPPHIAHEP